MMEIESYVAKFFENLPSTTIVCMSLLGVSYAGLLDELVHYPSDVYGWILLSHLNADSQPAVLLLPLSTVLQGNISLYHYMENFSSYWSILNRLFSYDDSDEETSTRETSTSCSIFGDKNVQKEWCSPWSCNTLVDDVAPLFKLILRGNYLSCSSFPEEHTERSRELWWTWRDNLDKRLHKLLW